jgi:hypothetical protein
VIGLFRSQDDTLRKLNDKVGTYRGGDVIWIGAICDAIAETITSGPANSITP